MTLPYLIIFLAVLSVSGASVLFQFASAEPLTVAFYRLGLSVLFLLPPLLWTRPRLPATRDVLLSMLSGVFLAAHFASWFFSLKLTSIASSTVLVSTHPLLILAYGYLFRKERTTGRAMTGVALAVLGAAVVGWGDSKLESSAVFGDLLAFFGAVTVSAYFLIGSTVRQRVSAIMYSVLTYLSASVVLVLTALVWGSPLYGFPSANWPVFAALAVFPTLFGHTLFNWALKYVPTSVISVNVLGEPIGATILAWLIWRTLPGPINMAGGALILLGIAFFLRYNKSQQKPADT